MPTKLDPYFRFRNNAREAMEFYRSVFGGKLTLTTFKEFHLSEDPTEDNKIMHAVLEAENGIRFMASDTPNRNEFKPGANIRMSLTGDNEQELKGYFTKLSAAGKVTMPLEKAVWGETFGMCMDRFGIEWMVSIPAQK